MQRLTVDSRPFIPLAKGRGRGGTQAEPSRWAGVGSVWRGNLVTVPCAGYSAAISGWDISVFSGLLMAQPFSVWICDCFNDYKSK